MEKIYIPELYINSPCKVINNGYIRAYTNNNLTNYVDIYINQDYMIKEGFSNYGYTGYCDNLNTYTSEFWYRTDIDKIVLIYFIFILSIIFVVKVILFRFFRRFN